MALIALGRSRCELCSGILHEGDDILGFDDGFVWEFLFLGDAAVHRQCFVQWKDREVFLAAYNAQFPSKHLDSAGHYGNRGETGDEED